jgi:hypothetical protein
VVEHEITGRTVIAEDAVVFAVDFLGLRLEEAPASDKATDSTTATSSTATTS